MQPPQSIEEIKAGLETTEKGGVRQSIRNCLTVFQRDPLLSGAIAYNILTDRKDIIKPIGFHRDSTALTTSLSIPYRMWTARNTSNAAVSMPSSGQHPTSCAGSTVCRWWSSPGQRNLHDMPGCGRPSTKPVRMPALRKISTGRCIGKGIFSAVIHTENMQPSGRGMVVEPCGFIGWEKNTILQP